jgi:hypothetical protein
VNSTMLDVNLEGPLTDLFWSGSVLGLTDRWSPFGACLFLLLNLGLSSKLRKNGIQRRLFVPPMTSGPAKQRKTRMASARINKSITIELLTINFLLCRSDDLSECLWDRQLNCHFSAFVRIADSASALDEVLFSRGTTVP